MAVRRYVEILLGSSVPSGMGKQRTVRLLSFNRMTIQIHMAVLTSFLSNNSSEEEERTVLYHDSSKMQSFLAFNSMLHTYIHNWPLQPFSQDYGLASYTAHVVCVKFIRE